MCSDALDTVLACDLPMMGTHIVWIDCADKFEICNEIAARKEIGEAHEMQSLQVHVT